MASLPSSKLSCLFVVAGILCAGQSERAAAMGWADYYATAYRVTSDAKGHDCSSLFHGDGDGRTKGSADGKKCAQTRPQSVGRGFQSRRELGTASYSVSLSRRYYRGLVMA